MRVGVVRTPAEERAWEHAKELARRQYPHAAGPDFYRTSNGYLQEADLLSTPHIVTAPASSNAKSSNIGYPRPDRLPGQKLWKKRSRRRY